MVSAVVHRIFCKEVRVRYILFRSFYAINAYARYILLNTLGLEISFIQWITLSSYNDTQFVIITL